MPYIANTPEQQEAMLRQIGRSTEELFSDIPPDLRCPGSNIPPGLTEQEVRNRLASMAARNKVDLISFLGGKCPA